jgi:hypothetical protein
MQSPIEKNAASCLSPNMQKLVYHFFKKNKTLWNDEYIVGEEKFLAFWVAAFETRASALETQYPNISKSLHDEKIIALWMTSRHEYPHDPVLKPRYSNVNSLTAEEIKDSSEAFFPRDPVVSALKKKYPNISKSLHDKKIIALWEQFTVSKLKEKYPDIMEELGPRDPKSIDKDDIPCLVKKAAVMALISIPKMSSRQVAYWLQYLFFEQNETVADLIDIMLVISKERKLRNHTELPYFNIKTLEKMKNTFNFLKISEIKHGVIRFMQYQNASYYPAFENAYQLRLELEKTRKEFMNYLLPAIGYMLIASAGLTMLLFFYAVLALYVPLIVVGILFSITGLIPGIFILLNFSFYLEDIGISLFARILAPWIIKSINTLVASIKPLLEEKQSLQIICENQIMRLLLSLEHSGQQKGEVLNTIWQKILIDLENSKIINDPTLQSLLSKKYTFNYLNQSHTLSFNEVAAIRRSGNPEEPFTLDPKDPKTLGFFERHGLFGKTSTSRNIPIAEKSSSSLQCEA